jgi:hypothetical protein
LKGASPVRRGEWRNVFARATRSAPTLRKKAASSKRWAFNLLNVRTHPAYEPARQFYLTNYAYAGWGEGLV